MADGALWSEEQLRGKAYKGKLTNPDISKNRMQEASPTFKQLRQMKR